MSLLGERPDLSNNVSTYGEHVGSNLDAQQPSEALRRSIGQLLKNMSVAELEVLLESIAFEQGDVANA